MKHTNFKRISKAEMKLFKGGNGADSTLEDPTACNSTPCKYYKNVGDKDMVSGTCGQMKGAMQVGCGCDGLVLNKDCDVTRNSN